MPIQTGDQHGEPPVKEAIEALDRAAVKPDREENAAGDGGGEVTGAHTGAQIAKDTGSEREQTGSEATGLSE